MKEVTLHGKPIKVGDKIWNFRSGWVTVEYLHQDDPYPIITNSSSCTRNGKRYLSDGCPSFFWKEQILDLSKPLPDLKVDDKVIVWDDEEYKYAEHFYNFNSNGNIVTFSDGQTSWSSDSSMSVWKYWEIPDDLPS